MTEPLARSESNKVRIKDFIALDETVLRVLLQSKVMGFLNFIVPARQIP
jgi:hypothetical protein